MRILHSLTCIICPEQLQSAWSRAFLPVCTTKLCYVTGGYIHFAFRACGQAVWFKIVMLCVTDADSCKVLGQKQRR